MARKNKKKQQQRLRTDPTQNRVQSGIVATSNNGKHIVKRKHWQLLADIRISGATSGVEDSYLTVGTEFLNTGINFRIREFVTSVTKVYDTYRIDRIDLFAEVSPARDFTPVTVISSFDPDDSVAITWQEMSQRQNSTMTTLKVFEPKKLIASFAPVPNFTNTGSAGADSPQNVVALDKPWIDSAATNQSYNGIKIFAASQRTSTFSLILHARAHISFMFKT